MQKEIQGRYLSWKYIDRFEQNPKKRFRMVIILKEKENFKHFSNKNFKIEMTSEIENQSNKIQVNPLDMLPVNGYE